MTLDLILDQLADLVAERVAARLGSARPAVYSSTNLPPGITRRTFNARCKSIPEATRDGKVWRCPVDAYERHLSRPATEAPKPPVRPDTIALLSSAGVRVRRAG